MGVKIADKLEQFNNGTYYLVDSSAVEYVDKDGNVKSVKDALDNAPTDESTHKTTIYENHIDMGKYMLLAKITNANYTNNIIKFSCPNYKGSMDVGFKYEDDMNIYKFELHFNTGSRRENNSYGVTLKQHGLGLYSYPLDNPKKSVYFIFKSAILCDKIISFGFKSIDLRIQNHETFLPGIKYFPHFNSESVAQIGNRVNSRGICFGIFGG